MLNVIQQSEYDRAVQRLLALGHELHAGTPRKFDLANMRTLLAALGNPERRFPSVLIAGTNGKGSTAATLHSILHAAGYRAGLYTSPHLIRVNERIRTDTGEISDPEFAEVYGRVEACSEQLLARGELPHHPSFFEMLTAMAFEYFASAGIEIAVLEVGMGGRLDATNVVEPCISVITDIAVDHQAFLGNTLTEIAREKAGIIRRKGVVITLPQHPEATTVLGNAIMEANARAVDAVRYMPPVAPGAAQQGNGLRHSYHLDVLGREISVASPLIGRHQFRNLALAIAAAIELKQFGFPITAEQIEAGIRNTRWPGRFQVLPAATDRPEMVLDVAHNPAGAWALRAALSQYYKDRSLIFAFGAMRDKAIAEISEILFPVAECVIATHAESPRAASPQEIAAAAARSHAEIICEPSVQAALARAKSSAASRPNAAIVITGSIYIVGEALRLLESRHSL